MLAEGRPLAGELLFGVLSRLPDGAPLGELAALSSPELVAGFARHGLSAYVADALERQQVVLSESHEQLIQEAQRTVAAGLKLRRLLFSVLDALAERGVSPIVLKGYGLASRLYPGPLVRPCTDVDVHVQRSELPVVGDALRSLGLRELHDTSLADVFEEHHHLPFVGTGGLVEVHFRLFNSAGVAFDEEGVRARSTAATLEGRSVRFLAPEDEFVYLANHAANHAFLRASWLVDLQLYLRFAPALDWHRMGDLARSAGCSVAVGAALTALEKTLAVRLPPAARDAFPARPWRTLVDSALFSTPRLATSRLAGGRLSSFLIRLLLVDSPGHGVRHVVEGAGRSLRRLRAGRNLR